MSCDTQFTEAALASEGWMIITPEDRAILADAMTAPDIPEISIVVPGLEHLLRDDHYILDITEALMLKELADIHDRIAELASKGRELAGRIASGKTPEDLLVIQQEAEHLTRVGLDSRTRANRLRQMVLTGFQRARETFSPPSANEEPRQALN